MRIALIADTFPPNRSSGAVQLRDLSREFVRQGHKLTVMLPSSDQKDRWSLETCDGVEILRLKAPQIRDKGRFQRAIAEFIMPFAMLRNFKECPLHHEGFEGVIWYSPSIFHGPFVNYIKKRSACKGYLIIRDIFPEWAVDMGLIGRGLPYRILDAVARYQYGLADVIGVQTSGNRKYFDQWSKQIGRTLEVLPNWLGEPVHKACSIRLNETVLNGRKIFVYAGNIGVAQGLDSIMLLMEKFRDRIDVGFLFVGRGSETPKLKKFVIDRGIQNVLIHDEIDPDEIPDLYAQCHAGIVALDHRHKTHNIPGKFLTYMQSGLPVLANVNLDNDLVSLIRSECVGQVCDDKQLETLLSAAEALIYQIEREAGDLEYRCKNLFIENYSVKSVVNQLIEKLEP